MSESKINRGLFEQSLSTAPETQAKVSEKLHQDIMRAVRLAKPVGRVTSTTWTVPAWGAGMAATAVAVFYLAQTPPVTPLQPDLGGTAATLTSLGEKLAALPAETAFPEEELRKELARIKSDLSRFGIGS